MLHNLNSIKSTQTWRIKNSEWSFPEEREREGERERERERERGEARKMFPDIWQYERTRLDTNLQLQTRMTFALN